MLLLIFLFYDVASIIQVADDIRKMRSGFWLAYPAMASYDGPGSTIYPYPCSRYASMRSLILGLHDLFFVS
jgi:hypothetical protein